MAESARIRVTLVYSPAARVVREWVVDVAQGASVREAIDASTLPLDFPELDLSSASIGIWGRKVVIGHALRNDDRIEIYRPLQVDPKLARRERFRKQGARAAGLFARKRAGGKAGY